MREMGDALKRRCLHLYIPLPDEKLEREIVASRVPGIEERLTKQLVKFVQSLREEDLKEVALDLRDDRLGAQVILLMHADSLDSDLVRDTLNVLLKFEQDIASVERRIPTMVRKSAE